MSTSLTLASTIGRDISGAPRPTSTRIPPDLVAWREGEEERGRERGRGRDRGEGGGGVKNNSDINTRCANSRINAAMLLQH